MLVICWLNSSTKLYQSRLAWGFLLATSEAPKNEEIVELHEWKYKQIEFSFFLSGRNSMPGIFLVLNIWFQTTIKGLCGVQ